MSDEVSQYGMLMMKNRPAKASAFLGRLVCMQEHVLPRKV